ncbi:MAG TPA: 50S ribosomal protein L3 [Candidatus Paceibacterota bacterium]
MKFILGTKVNMVQYFSEDGKVFPATIVSAGPVVVTQVKNKETDGYEAIQVGFGPQKEARLSKAIKGHLKDLGFFKHIKEFRAEDNKSMSLKKGDKIDVSVFAKGDVVRASGISKGKGFQGVVKRHGFHGGPRSHGQKHSEREPGSIGGGLRTRVPKGMRMAGRMGSDLVTVSGLKVLEVDKDKNTLLISGAIPGRRGSLIEIRS